MASPGWYATGLLQPLWAKYPGGRDALAEKIGTTGNSLSARNTGSRTLGIDLASRLAEELDISLLELGAPEGLADDQASVTLATRLEGLGEKVEFLLTENARLSKDLKDARTRLGRLERARRQDQAAATQSGGA